MNVHGAKDTQWVDSLEGATTHFFTNTVRLGFTDEELVGLARATLPVSCAPKVIHEAVHHWFFQTMLGESVALAKMAAYEHLKNGDADAAADLAARYTFLLNLYRPIFEGAALLGEFDALPMELAHSPIPPHNLLPLLFSKSTREMPELIERSSNIVAVVLAELRNYKHFTNAKSRLFATTEDNAVDYLFGYHDLRHWWLTFVLAEKGKVYLDGNVFLKLVHLYFFWDFKLALLLFGRRKSLDESLAALEAYLARRLRAFPELAGNDKLAAFLANMPPGQPVTIEDLQSLGVFESDAHAGIQHAGEAMMLVFGNRPLDRSAIPGLRIQQNRRPFHLASEPVRIRVDATRLVVETISGKPMYGGALQTPAPKTEQDGIFSSFIFMDKCVLVNTVVIDGTVLLRWFFGPGEITGEMRADAARMDADRSDLDALAGSLEQALHEKTSFDEELEALMARCEATKRTLFGYAGCLDESRGDARAWLDQLVATGLQGQLSKEATRALALLGNARARLDIGPDRPRELLEAEGIDVAVIRKLETISDEMGIEGFGWRFFATNGDRWCPLL